MTFDFSHVQYSRVQSGLPPWATRYLESGEKARLTYSPVGTSGELRTCASQLIVKNEMGK